METAFNPDTEIVLIRLLIQFAIIILAARLVGSLFYRLGQVRTVGEIFAGILLGPSFLGWVYPDLFRLLFPPAGAGSPSIIPYFSHMALVFTLFLIGMEFDFREVPKYGKHVLTVAVTTLLVPVSAGVLLAFGLWSVVPSEGEFLPYALFIGICIAITAIPIMGRVLMELGLTHTKMAVLGISTAASKDIMTWFFMAVVIGIARPPVDVLSIAKMIGLTVLLGVTMLTVGRWLLAVGERRWPIANGRPNPNLLVGVFVVLLLAAAATSEIGIFAIFGAFFTGVMVSSRRELANAISDRIHDLTIYFLLPLFFTYTGLRADLTQLNVVLIGWVLVITVVASLANGLPAYALTRRAGMSYGESISMASLINMPGLMVLIVLNIAYDLQVLPPLLFSVLLSAAMIRNLLVAPVLRRMMVRPGAERAVALAPPDAGVPAPADGRRRGRPGGRGSRRLAGAPGSRGRR